MMVQFRKVFQKRITFARRPFIEIVKNSLLAKVLLENDSSFFAISSIAHFQYYYNEEK